MICQIKYEKQLVTDFIYIFKKDVLEQWLVTFNPNITESLIISLKISRRHHPQLLMYNSPIVEVDIHKHLGITYTCSTDGRWEKHIKTLILKASFRLSTLRRLNWFLDRNTLTKLYVSFIRPILEYGDVVWCK